MSPNHDDPICVCGRCLCPTDGLEGQLCQACCAELDYEDRMREVDEQYERDTGYWPGERP